MKEDLAGLVPWFYPDLGVFHVKSDVLLFAAILLATGRFLLKLVVTDL